MCAFELDTHFFFFFKRTGFLSFFLGVATSSSLSEAEGGAATASDLRLGLSPFSPFVWLLLFFFLASMLGFSATVLLVACYAERMRCGCVRRRQGGVGVNIQLLNLLSLSAFFFLLLFTERTQYVACGRYIH